jgi:hypothetical protein
MASVPKTPIPERKPVTSISSAKATPVTAENFVRAESDMYFGVIALKEGGFGKFEHHRAPADVQNQTVVRLNRDTLYSAAVFDFEAGPVTITLPDAGDRFMSLQIINQDEYVPAVYYGAGRRTLTRDLVGTRYALVGVRILSDPSNAEDIKKVNALQDGIQVEQARPGTFEVPHWDPVSQKKVREALLVLAETLPDSKRMFGTAGEVDPIRHLVGAASLWGGNPEKDAVYLNFTPVLNDGKTVHKLVVKDVPVDGFWSISLYNAKGYFEPNDRDSYSINNITGKKSADGSVEVHLGGCDENSVNCLPIMPGWNYTVRLYRPRAEVFSGQWKFPAAVPVR